MLIATAAVLAAVVAIVLVIGIYGRFADSKSASPRTYLGVYTAGLPESYAGVSAFTAATGVRPGLVMYYSGWLERFQSGFAAEAARHGAVPVVQIEPTGVSLAAIASGRYDAYLRSYAASVRAFGNQVILSFGHEMNGYWYSWGYRHTSPAAFVAAWRHVVTVFRQQGASNVTWLWTANVIDAHGGIPSACTVVAWWLVCGLGGDRWLLPQAGLDIRVPLWPDNQSGARADPRQDTHYRNGRQSVNPWTSQQRSLTCSLAFARTGYWGSCGLTPWRAMGPRNGMRDWRLSGQAAFAAYRRGARAYRRPS